MPLVIDLFTQQAALAARSLRGPADLLEIGQTTPVTATRNRR